MLTNKPRGAARVNDLFFPIAFFSWCVWKDSGGQLWKSGSCAKAEYPAPLPPAS
jgi:hypothetical protein